MANDFASSFIPPEEIRNTRIGQMYFLRTREFKNKGADRAFNFKMLGSKGLLDLSKGITYKDYTRISRLSKTDESSQWGLDIGLNGSFGGVKASVKFKMGVASQMIQTSNTTNTIVRNIQKEVCLKLVNFGTNKPALLECLQPEVHSDYLAIVEAKSSQEKLKAYMKFCRKWGDSCVTSVKLMAGCVAMLSVSEASDTNSKRTQLEAGLSAATAGGSFGGNIGFVKDTNSFSNNQSLNISCQTVVFPSETTGENNYSKWVDELTALAENAKKTLSEKETIKQDITFPTPPAIPTFTDDEIKSYNEKKGKALYKKSEDRLLKVYRDKLDSKEYVQALEELTKAEKKCKDDGMDTSEFPNIKENCEALILKDWKNLREDVKLELKDSIHLSSGAKEKITTLESAAETKENENKGKSQKQGAEAALEAANTSMANGEFLKAFDAYKKLSKNQPKNGLDTQELEAAIANCEKQILKRLNAKPPKDFIDSLKSYILLGAFKNGDIETKYDELSKMEDIPIETKPVNVVAPVDKKVDS